MKRPAKTQRALRTSYDFRHGGQRYRAHYQPQLTFIHELNEDGTEAAAGFSARTCQDHLLLRAAKGGEPDHLEITQHVFDFLTGHLPEGYKVDNMPNLTEDRAWTALWFLGNLHYSIRDHIERCDVCGRLYDSHSGGDTLDYGRAPYSFCDGCMSSDTYLRKARRNPDKDARP